MYGTVKDEVRSLAGMFEKTTGGSPERNEP